MLKTIRKIYAANLIGAFVLNSQWHFEDTNINDLYKKIISINETNTFNIDVASIKWEDYFKNFTLGIRQFMLRDIPDTLPQARIKLKRLVVYILIKNIQENGKNVQRIPFSNILYSVQQPCKSISDICIKLNT